MLVRIVSIVSLVLLAVPALALDLDTAWVRRYNGTGNGWDNPYDMKVDSAGNVYVAGGSTGSGTSLDLLTIKYHPGGDTAWTRMYNGPGNGDDYAQGLALDPSGCVLVTGPSLGAGTGTDFATIKYDPDGNELWVRRYDGPASGDDAGSDVVVDDSGSVYVTGRSVGFDYDYATVKYDKDGNQLWVQRYGYSAYDESRNIALDAFGNVYVTGYSYYPTTNYDFATIKYDSSGNELWVRRLDGPWNADDYGSALTVDDSCNVYVFGTVRTYSTGYDYGLVKYDSSGNQLWVRVYNGVGNGPDWGYGIAPSCSGGVYVNGRSWGSGTEYDFATLKYDPDGTQMWVRRYDGPAGGNDETGVITVDESDNAYVAGPSVRTGTSWDYVIIKYDGDGNPLWLRRMDGPANGEDRPTAIDMDTSGNLYLTGRSMGIGTDHDVLTMKYCPTELSSLVGHWQMNEVSGIIAHDASGYGNDGVLQNGGVWAEGFVGGALALDGVDDHVVVVDNPSLSGFSQLTLAAWVKLSSFSSDGRALIAKGDGNGLTGDEYSMWIRNGKVGFCVSDGSQWLVWMETTGDLITQLDKWYHVAAKWEGDSSAIFVDGSEVLAGGGVNGTSHDTPSSFWIGSTSLWPWTFFHGSVDDVRIYGRALGSDEIDQLAGRLVGYWKFDEDSGDTADDSSGYLNHGTLMYGSSRVESLPLLGQALNLDGTDDHVVVPDAPSLDMTGPFTTMAWVLPETLPAGTGDAQIASFVNKWMNYILQTGESAPHKPGRLRLVSQDSQGQWYALESDSVMTLNQWQHVAGSWDGDSLKLFLNAGQIASLHIESFVPGPFNDQDLYIGTEKGNWQFFDGSIDEVKVYRRALSLDEIRTEFENGFIRGDANGDGSIDLGDAVHILNYLFKGGPAPGPLEAGDANCTGAVDLGDAIYILNYLFKGGDPPGCP